ncbi:MAG: histidine kinase [Alphaproteobacteria bacterium]|nr:histidine kinase [Alphaproteobacteria bacterium]
MTKVIVSRDNPSGWPLEELLAEIQNDIVRRSANIIDDHRPEARVVLHNNIEILALLTQAVKLAKESQKKLESLGPADPKGNPRIGGGKRP